MLFYSLVNGQMTDGLSRLLVSAVSAPAVKPSEPIGTGSLEILRIHRPTYKKQKFVARLTLDELCPTCFCSVAPLAPCDEPMLLLFTGSPPLMLHFIAPLNLLLRKKLIYRITDFHPECLIAERGRAGFILGLLLRLTQFWRRRVDQFEVLGFDQARRLAECGIEDDRIILKRDPSPVTFPSHLPPLSSARRIAGSAGRHFIFR